MSLKLQQESRPRPKAKKTRLRSGIRPVALYLSESSPSRPSSLHHVLEDPCPCCYRRVQRCWIRSGGHPGPPHLHCGERQCRQRSPVLAQDQPQQRLLPDPV
eukprot:663113-Rhodomonas_salina.1